MNDMKFDFSGASKVRESLKASLMMRYAARRGNRERIEDSMLDQVVAAGTPNMTMAEARYRRNCKPEQN